MVLDAALLNTQYYKICIKGNMEQSRDRSCALLSVAANEKEPLCRPWQRSLTLLNRPIVFANRPGDLGSIPGRVIPMTQKWYLTYLCFILIIIRYVWRVRWSNPRKGVAPFPTPRFCSYWKGKLRIAFDKVHQLNYLWWLISRNIYK